MENMLRPGSPFEQSPYLCREYPVVNRFDEIVGCPLFQSFDNDIRIGHRREEEKWGFSSRESLQISCTESKSVHLGHHEIGYDHVGFNLFQKNKGLSRCREASHLESGLFQGALGNLDHNLVIINNYNHAHSLRFTCYSTNVSIRSALL